MADRLYYDRTQGAPPWPELLKALELLGRTDGLAIDLGCGAGRDSLELLRRGWQVLAVDKAAEALERLQAQLDPAWAPRLQTRCEPFEHTELPAAHLVNSAFALPFCAPAHFPGLWQRIERALAGGGLFCGNLLGERDDWAGPEVCTFTRTQLDALLAGWEVLHLEEIDRDGTTARGRTKHWHLYGLIARRP